MNIIIRFANENDFIKVRLFDPHSKYIDYEKIRRKIQADEVILAFEENQIIGIIKFSYFWATRPYMDLIWVAEDKRGRGIGTKMLNFLEKYLVENGYTYLYTSAEEADDAPQAWHKNHGFKVCGVLSALNYPHDRTNEIFYYKHIADSDPDEEELRTYPVLPASEQYE